MWGLCLVWMPAASSSVCLVLNIPLVRSLADKWWPVCSGCWVGLLLLCGCHSPVGDRVCSLVVGVEAPRSISESPELWCEVGRIGASPPGEEPLSIPLPELSTGECSAQSPVCGLTRPPAQIHSSQVPGAQSCTWTVGEWLGGSPDLVPA